MKEKILLALKTKYAALGLSEAVLDGIAESLSKTVTDEAGVETAVNGVEPILKSFQSSFDQLRNEKSGLQKELDTLRGTPKPEPKPKPNTDPNPKPVESEGVLTKESIANLIAEQLKPITDRFAKQDQSAKETERRGQIIAKAKEYKIPEAVAKYMNVPDGSDLDTFMKQAKQDFSNNGFSEVKPPESAESQIKSDNESIAKMIDDGTKSIVEQSKK